MKLCRGVRFEDVVREDNKKRKLKYEHLLKFKVPKCKVCRVELTNKNWHPSRRAASEYICKDCYNERRRLRYAEKKRKLREKE